MDSLYKLIINEDNKLNSFIKKCLTEEFENRLAVFEDVEIDNNSLNERVIRKYVIRKGKKIKKKVSSRANTKMVDGKEVLMKASERIKRKKAARKRAIKLKSKQSVIARKRKKSMKKRKFIK